jgi:hypothetical protein
VTRGVAWFAAGVAVGVALSRRAARSTAGSVVEAAGTAIASRVRRSLDDVIADGRVEMRRREARLREVLAAPAPRAEGAAGGRR